jgi:membrane protease YdiL (CAAX protease family)
LQWKPRRRWLMIALSAFLFALIHMNPAQMPHAFLIGLLLGWLYMRTGSIMPGVAYHWANNTAAYALYHLYHNPQSLQDIVGPGTRPVLLALLFSLCILLPALLQLNIRMQRLDK